jgi:uncharacterized oligopeptide transporter (OPT) family protein
MIVVAFFDPASAIMASLVGEESNAVSGINHDDHNGRK